MFTKKKIYSVFGIFVLCCLCSTNLLAQVKLTGDLKEWHKVTLEITGPQSSESAEPSPFADYKLTGIFTKGNKSYTIPGYFAADGNAAETSAKSGNIWKIHFSPNEPGEWKYTIRFRQGAGIAVSDKLSDGKAVKGLDKLKGKFTIVPTDKKGKDLRGKGHLQYVGEHHLRFAGNGEWFLKAGADSPENLLDYADFDDTPDLKKWQKTWSPHLKDWKNGDPTWQGDKGKGLIGAINYLSSQGANSISFLTMAVKGDDRSVFPWDDVDSRDRFDCSKLDQWEIVFSHAEKMGMYLHFKLSETENETLLNDGDLGFERKLYYRELIARFAHHNAMNWNIGEENGIDFKNKKTGKFQAGQTTEQQVACIQYLSDTDPYKNHVVLHTAPNFGKQKDQYNNLIGDKSALTGVSIQTHWHKVFDDTRHWVTESAKTGKKWVVANDEQGHAQLGVPHDDFTGSPNLHDIRKQTLWGNLMAGGAGVEYYFGYGDKIPKIGHDDLIFNSSDMRCEDFRTRERSWRYAKLALDFFNQYVPFWETLNDNSLTSLGQCLYLKDKVYVIYLEKGGEPKVELGAGIYDVKWYNPRFGGELINGKEGITGGESVSIGKSPDTENDWVALVQKQGYEHAGLPNAQISVIDEVMDIELSKSSITMAQPGDTYQLKSEIYPATAKNKNVSWESSKPNVITVSNSGLVTAKGNGTAEITAKAEDGGKKASCAVMVGKASNASIQVHDDFIVFEIQATNSPLGEWVLRTPEDPTYLPGTEGVDPIGDNYLEFMGNNINTGAPNSPLVYKFTPKTDGTYWLTARMRQNLLAHGTHAQDKCNDVYIKMEGDFTSTCKYSTSDLQKNMKFWGRGTKLKGETEYHWGSMVKGDLHHVLGEVKYNLKAGVEYTFTISGRAKGVCIDYILLFKTSTGLEPGYNEDIAIKLPEKYRPVAAGGNSSSLDFYSFSDFQDIKVNGFKPAYKDKGNKCLAINAVKYKGDFAAATTTFNGESGTYNVKLTTLTETDGESSYRVKIGGKLIGTYQNPETTVDYAKSEFIWEAVSIKKGDIIQVEFNSHTNGKIPEKGGTAYSRGRWEKISISKSAFSKSNAPAKKVKKVDKADLAKKYTDGYIEKDGKVVIDFEDASDHKNWTFKTGNNSFGKGYLQYTGPDSYVAPNMSQNIGFKVKINTPGTYQFKWRAGQDQSHGQRKDESNDSYLRITADKFFGICRDKSDHRYNKEIDASGDFIKVFMSTRGEFGPWCKAVIDGAHGCEMYATFNSPGEYFIEVSGRSEWHMIDRLYLFKKGTPVPASAEEPSSAMY